MLCNVGITFSCLVVFYTVMACQGSFLHLLSAPCSVSSSSAKESEKGQMRGYGAAVKACKAIRIKSEARPNGKTV